MTSMNGVLQWSSPKLRLDSGQTREGLGLIRQVLKRLGEEEHG